MQDRRRNERAKLRIFREMETVATCSTTDCNGSYHGLAPSFFEEMTRCRCQKHCRQWPDNPNGPSKFCKYRVYLLHLRLCDCDCCSAADCSGSCHAPAPSYFEMTRCRRQILQWRWPGNPNGRSKFRNLGLFTIATDAPAAAPRLMAASGDRSNGTLPTSKTSPAMTRIDRNSANTQIYAYEIKQNVSKNFFFLLRTTPRLTALRTIYFPAITRNDFFFHIRKIISQWPGPPPKNWYTYCSFFRFYL